MLDSRTIETAVDAGLLGVRMLRLWLPRTRAGMAQWMTMCAQGFHIAVAAVSALRERAGWSPVKSLAGSATHGTILNHRYQRKQLSSPMRSHSNEAADDAVCFAYHERHQA